MGRSLNETLANVKCFSITLYALEQYRPVLSAKWEFVERIDELQITIDKLLSLATASHTATLELPFTPRALKHGQQLVLSFAIFAP